MKLIILGPQACGKGTQASKLAEHLHIPHISTGDIFRDHIKKGTELGKKAAAIINDGGLMPDEITEGIITHRLGQEDCKRGFLLDGFPRDINQAKFLEKKFPVDKAVVITLSDDVAVARIGKRRVCTATKKIYVADQIKSQDIEECKAAGGEIIVRDDDKPDAVRVRLKIYHEKTEPLVDFFKEKGKVVEINGEQSIDAVFVEIKSKLQC